MSRLIDSFIQAFEGQFGYPPDEHYVRTPTPGDNEAADRDDPARVSTIPSDLREFYSTIAEVSLPDLDSGYFIHPLTATLDSDGHFPRKVTGAVEDSIVVFGSDGGGSLLAVGAHRGDVYRLSGAQVGSEYDVAASGFEVAAPSLGAYLRYLHDRMRLAVDSGQA
jgi:hypothetical protein